MGINFLDNDTMRAEDRRAESIPVGYERAVELHALDFEEYLWATGVGEDAIAELGSYLQHPDRLDDALRETIKNKFAAQFGKDIALREHQLSHYGICPKCGAPIDRDFVVCPICNTQVRNVCPTCHRPLNADWKVCPYCRTRIQ